MGDLEGAGGGDGEVVWCFLHKHKSGSNSRAWGGLKEEEK